VDCVLFEGENMKDDLAEASSHAAAAQGSSGDEAERLPNWLGCMPIGEWVLLPGQSAADDFSEGEDESPAEMCCTCQGCGIGFKVDLLVPDALWEQIKPDGKAPGAGLLCGHCILNRIEALVVYAVVDLAAPSGPPQCSGQVIVAAAQEATQTSGQDDTEMGADQ
jgi:hypothetical protein